MEDTINRRAGVILVVVSAFVFSTAGIFAKGVPTAAWDIIFWRGVAASGFTFTYLFTRNELVREARLFGKPALAVTLVSAAGSAAFIPAFKLSSVANVALIYGAAPFLAAAMAWVFISERPSRRVVLASVLAFCGVGIILSGSLGGVQIKGDALALCMTLLMAGGIVIYRKYPDTTAALPAALSSVVLLFPACVFGDPFEVPLGEIPVLILFGLVFAVASVTLMEGARRLPAAETALLSILEMPLAPVLALLVLGAMPTPQAVIGGCVIIGAVAWSQRRAI